MESLPLIDVASEHHLLLMSPPSGGYLGASKGFQLATIDAEGGETSYLNSAMDQIPELSESPKQKKPKSSVNLRKSLAWDSAFFTSEGVLNTEELAIVNSTFRNADASKLPEIPEETSRSGESTSTLDCESWVLENLETDLFDNVRASIQRSLGISDSSKTPSSTNPSRHGPRQKVDRMSQTKTKLPLSTVQGVISQRHPEATSKKPPSARLASLGTAEAKASSRPPRILPRAAIPRVPGKTTIAPGNADKRSSTGGGANRQPIGKSANGSIGVTSQPVGASKCTAASGYVFLANPSASLSISNTTTKSPPLNIHKKRTAQRIAVHSSSGSASNKFNPARISRNKIPTRGQANCTSSSAPTMKCPSISPSSSVDSMISVISEVSSTASIVGKLNHTTEILDAQSSSPSFGKSNSHPPIMNLRPATAAGNLASGMASGEHSKTSTKGKGSKPSALRMPTPKIGYFDADKSLDQKIDTLVQPAKLPCSLPNTQKPNLSSIQVTKAASPASGQPESKLAVAHSKDNGASQTKVPPYKVAEIGVTHANHDQVYSDLVASHSKASLSCREIEQEAHSYWKAPAVGTDNAKENIPILHPNSQPDHDLSTLTVELMTQKLSSILLFETTDLMS